MLNFNKSTFFYDPYPHCILDNFLEESMYENICKEFPNLNYFEELQNKDSKSKFNKYQFSNSSKQIKSFNNFIDSTIVTKKLYQYLNSEKFIISLDNFLLDNKIELRLKKKKNIKTIIKNFFFKKPSIDFEFSSISLDNGYIRPHTDGPNKLLGLVIPIIGPNDNYNAKNLGTKILKAKTNEYKFNYYNRTVPLEETELVRELPFKKNQLSIHVKTFNSLHSVGPILNLGEKKNIFRKSISIFIMK